MVVPAPVDDVWSACTNPSRLDRWLLPVRGDLRVGGAFALDGNAHGEILVCEPPARLRVTWRYPEMPTDEVELRLELLEGGETRLELEHASIRPPTFVLNDPGTDRWGVGAGWEVPLRVGLLPHLRGALPNRPAVEWFAFTPEVVAIADEAGLRWATAVGEA